MSQQHVKPADQVACDNGSYAHGETNDCTVRAVSLATGMPYAQAHAAMALRGRKPRKGAHYGQYASCIREAGFQLTETPFRPCTPRTIGRQFRSGTFLVHIRRHVFIVRDGQVLDWSQGRRHRVTWVQRVTPVGAPVVPATPVVPLKVYNRPANHGEVLQHLRKGACTVAELANLFEVTEKSIRNAIDRLRKIGYDIRNVGPGTFQGFLAA